MSTRLYPNTDNPVVLEKLAGVVPGTAARWAEFRKLHGERDVYAALLDREPGQMLKYHEFLGDGFNRLTRLAADLLELLGQDWVMGEIRVGDCQPRDIELILMAQNIDLHGVKPEELEGIHWS